MLIEVTQKHIDDGIRCDGQRCAVALAIREKVGFDVGFAMGLVMCGIDEQTYVLPMIATNNMVAFDNGRKVQPFTFEMEKAC